MSHKIAADIVLDQIHKVHPDIEIIGEYKSKAATIRVRCCKCSFSWNSTANRLLAGHGCRKCAGQQKRHKRGYYRKTHDQFIAEMQIVCPSILIQSQYQSAKSPVSCFCRLCGNVWEARPTNLLSGIGCPICAIDLVYKKQVKQSSEFLHQMQSIHPDINVIGKYSGNKENIRLSCMRCRNEWEAMPINLLRTDGKATGCPHCKRSHGESGVAQWLDDNLIDYEPQKSFVGLVGVGGRPLSYDFFVPEYNLLIEYQGQYHDNTARNQTDRGFSIQKEHDKRKRQFASDNSINILEIWYYEDVEDKLTKTFDNIKEPVTTTAS